jgi:DNA-binding PadR family transcriptional regulator
MPDKPRDVSALLPLKGRYLEILVSVADGARHGYGIMQDVRSRSQGRVQLWPAALYGSLRELEDRGLIEETATRPSRDEDDERRRYYRLTARGRRVLAAEIHRLEDLVETARAAGVMGRPKKA